jgi:hypothetical protein
MIYVYASFLAVQRDEVLLKKSERDEAEEVKKVAQTVACFYAIGGVLLLLLTLRFVFCHCMPPFQSRARHEKRKDDDLSGSSV